MTKEERYTLTKRIQKLLALGTSDNENESKSALNKAAALAEKHGLAISDITFDDEAKPTAKVDETKVQASNKRNATWERVLCGAIARSFDAETIIITNWDKSVNYSFVGTPSDVEMCIWYFKMVRLKIMRGAKIKFALVKEQQSYGLGATVEIRDRLHTMFVVERERLRSQTTRDLVIVKKDIVADEVKKLYPNMIQSRRKTPKMDQGAFKAGQDAGKTMVLNKQLRN